MIRTTKRPNDHFEGKWEKGKKYTLYSIVKNNGSFFRAVTAKAKGEPYVIFNAETGEYSANDGWEIAYMSEDSRISSGGGDAAGKLAVLEDILGITLDPDLDEKYYQYFTIEATGNGTKVYFRQSSYAVTDGIDPLKVEVSTDNGETWTEVVAAAAEDDVPGATLAELDEGDKVLIRGKNEAYGYASPPDSLNGFCENCNFWADRPCYVYGNIMSLVGGDDFARLRKVKEGAFTFFFSDYDGSLDYSWVLSKEDEELILPATTLASNCYDSMFCDCTGLTSAPALPATTLAEYCYSYMFNGCTSLITAPELPATTLARYCYSNMFNGCTGLTSAPELVATTLASYCYDLMFADCTGLTSAPALPATTLAQHCYSYMLSGCTGLTAAPELSATTLVDGCYISMFRDCTGLTTAPELPATTLAEYCYTSMFNGCTSLTTAPELPATTLASKCYDSMFLGCTGLTEAPVLSTMTLAEYCYSNMFADCTGLTTAPELPATTLASKCYDSMFKGCSNLAYIKAMFTTTPGSSYTSNWVLNVKATGTFIKNSAATWNVTGDNGVPSGWTVETADA